MTPTPAMLIAQLSDPHVCAPGERYQGVADANGALDAAIDHLHGLDRRPDLVLLSGDLTDEGRPAEYLELRRLLDRLELPYLVVPGNHDDREGFRTTFPDRQLPSSGPLHFCVDTHPVRIIGLDTCVPGEHHGHLDPEGLSWLSTELARDPARPTVLMLHHPPFVSGIPYMDLYRLMDPGPLEEVVRGAPNVELVLCGHVHRTMVRRWAGTVVVSCPSTVTEIDLQLSPGARPQSHLGPAACLLHWWDPPHGMVSHVSQIDPRPGPFPFA